MMAKEIHDTFHRSLLLPYTANAYGRKKLSQHAVRPGDGSLEYEVDKVRDRKKGREKIFYLVK